MNDIAIRADGLGKRYRIGAKQEGYKTLRDTLGDVFIAPFRRVKRLASGQGYGAAVKDQTFWALRDLSFQIKRGEVVGVIGKNGAGKTTLLKILSRITEPTKGQAEIHGRVGSLLEVGTGFHPELTGRENIYLNGAILGMRKAEIERKFDEILDFAGIENFIDTPVKHYSSGMYVRLAFAVAAHLEPEVLLVDEVLAVGDAAFQRKCLGKIGDVVKEGRTVLFVSHNMAVVRTLTEKCMYLQDGHLVSYDRTSEIVDQYLADTLKHKAIAPNDLEFYRRKSRLENAVRFVRIWIDKKEEQLTEILIGDSFTLFMNIESKKQRKDANITISLKKLQGDIVVTILSWDSHFKVDLQPGLTTVSCKLDGLNLVPGFYLIDLGINAAPLQNAWDVILDYPIFEVKNLGEKKLVYRPERSGAVVCGHASWSNISHEGKNR
jgi:lipopolysaccharide transport system ATP-binding protein